MCLRLRNRETKTEPIRVFLLAPPDELLTLSAAVRRLSAEMLELPGPQRRVCLPRAADSDDHACPQSVSVSQMYLCVTFSS